MSYKFGEERLIVSVQACLMFGSPWVFEISYLSASDEEVQWPDIMYDSCIVNTEKASLPTLYLYQMEKLVLCLFVDNK